MQSIGKRTTAIVSGGAVWVALASSAQAGMTVYGLNDLYRLRLQEISFFLLLLVVCSFVFKLLWNHATRGFPAVPRVKFLQALSICLLFGIGMLLILTMISGIREVLTPEAWRKQGTSYRLNDPAQDPARQRSLQQLRTALFDYARQHEGKFPPHDFVPEIPDKLWEAPDQLGTHYVYSGGISQSDANAILAVEPVVFGEPRYVLTAGGQIEKLSAQEILQRRAVKVAP